MKPSFPVCTKLHMLALLFGLIGNTNNILEICNKINVWSLETFTSHIYLTIPIQALNL